jgi:hypothetical protein
MKRRLFALALLVSGFAAATAIGQVVDVDPSKDYPLTADVGAWTICAACYVGPESPKLAHDLALEIRTRYHLPAYVLNKGEEERRKEQERLQRLHEQYKAAGNVPLRTVRIEDQCAVLIGGYKDIEAANKALKSIKKLPPPSSEKYMPFLTQVVPDKGPDGEQRGRVEGAYINPFVKSFVVRNPLVPKETSNEKKPDPFLKNLNSGEKYSLLHCRKPYTLLVATFQGMSTFHAQEEPPGFWEKLWKGYSGEMLEASGQNAHNLAEAMRKMGFEAYVLHMRQGSVVTIGGYDSPDDPRMKETQQTLAQHVQLDRSGLLLAQFVPMPVPRP